MQESDEYQSYEFNIWLMTNAMLITTAFGAAIAIFLRMWLMRQLNQSLIHAAAGMETTARILKKACLDPMTVAVMADEKRDKKDTDICDQFDSLHKKPLKHCADLFGYDTLTKDYVK
ncbi:MotA/TolQ/ExbB proton channel family protein [Caenorhabditis elegans]|uniref:MotA/TolQ/ExbB proton channel family protein n=1 Tax=Caenorhabditis elegans TaxID=6239 RepID=O16597_CAEEL|nr:MotA/TolQ/ExbB proton channel family protein [Caenorhabditis elegans]CCD68439.2 MotA/TolQ/ExbB proton channel family protein [Caenorhabditis elegans]|eukprot:NP_494308.2 Uncharacterized protein CELE_D2062.5 [Caenorhabditis elegans]